MMDETRVDRLTVEHLSSLQSVTKALRDEQFRCQDIILETEWESDPLSLVPTVLASLANISAQ